APAPHGLDAPRGLRHQGGQVPGVGARRLDAEGGGTGIDIPGQGLRLRGALSVEVILEHDQERELPLGGDVERLVDGPLAERTIAEEDDGDPAAAANLMSECHPGRYRDDTPLDAVAEDAPRANVLAAAASTAGSRLLAHHLCDQTL